MQRKNSIMYRNTKAGYAIISTGIVHVHRQHGLLRGTKSETVWKIHVVAGFRVFAFSEHLSS
jgi:hypothetical protein